MRQLFFISPNGFPPVRQAFEPPVIGARTHGWCAENEDPHTGQIVGVVELDGRADSEEVITRLEAAGIQWLPNHRDNAPIADAHADALARHGVRRGHTTAEALTAVHSVSGFPPHKPRRF